MYETYHAQIKEERPRPPVKWAGGKSQLISQFEPLFPKEYSLYVEPFVGGGAVFFHLLPPRAVLIDSNDELINFYLVVRDDLEALLQDLKRHENTAEYYYRIRALDPDQLTPVERASRFLYLNKTGYNGLWRVNSRGQHNVPFGRYKNPKIVDEPNLRLVSGALKKAEIICDDFSQVLDCAAPGAFVYLDPPYHPLSETANFTSYTPDAFGEDDQRRLAEVFRELDRRGCLVMLSNSDTPFIRELYKNYDIQVVYAKRAINCRADKRGPISELVIRNYN
ncbi:DNA adenine methylase [Desulfofundulus australicus DSM 11792]|uniref:Site-specific DNA-methyltransferase (adenine-specific) n=1 Tax=Desulfofundulus australicus DSM 11792 TaxID=1121425 RepID=A0A1M4Y143_9FIRM|nr:DNA adenine methylase [Desulfofundulus australicus]SHE99390.1 DNA adenine methylase [Desulfofundulus australicus DSM 11792]